MGPTASVEGPAEGPAEALHRTGYVVFPGLYDDAFSARGRDALARIYAELGSPPLSRRGKAELPQSRAILSGSGLMVGELLAHAPELIDGYLHPQILAVLEQSLGPDYRIETTAGMISDHHRIDVLGWHNHVGGLDEDLERAVDYATLSDTRIRRVTLLIYVDGLSKQLGELIVWPRTLGDSLDPPNSEDERDLDDSHAVTVVGPPGTAVLLEERTWHGSRARKTPGYRRFVGAMLMAAWAPAPVNVDATVAGFADRLLGRQE